LCKRPYPWRKDLISMVFGVTISAAIIVSNISHSLSWSGKQTNFLNFQILASCSYSIIHLHSIPCADNIVFMLATIVADVMLPIYLFQVGFGLLKDEKGRWSYQGRDWCANPHHGGCNRLVYVLSILNRTAGYIAIFIGCV
jgi:hypothetical protein